jgi:hypothetical protein
MMSFSTSNPNITSTVIESGDMRATHMSSGAWRVKWTSTRERVGLIEVAGELYRGWHVDHGFVGDFRSVDDAVDGIWEVD